MTQPDFLSDHAREEVAAAIKSAEARTSGEIVTVVARRAHTHSSIMLVWPALVALLIPGLIAPYVAVATPTGLYEWQLGLFIVLELLLLIPAVRFAVVPGRIKRRWAGQLAREQFFERGLHLTRERTGVLVFVSVAERYVEILADAGINRKVDPSEWQKIVDEFVAHVRHDQITEGFVKAVEAVGKVLAVHFPESPSDVNELPDRLFVI